MKRFGIWMGGIACLLMSIGVASTRGAEMSADQKDAAAKLQAKGGLVIPVAANSDALIVSLSTAGKNAGDADLALVKALPKVEQLDLRNTAITNAGLANIEGLATLTHLHLEGTAVTDEGLGHLKGLSALTYLNLYNTAVTDQGVAQLSDLKSLKRLYLWQTKVTDAGVAGLKKTLPELYVNRGEEMTLTTQPVALPAPDMKGKGKKPAAVTPEKKPEEKKPDDKKPAVAAGKPINSKCPLKGEDVDPAHVVVFEGKTIGLCCEKCEAKFAADPKKFIDKVVADVK